MMKYCLLVILSCLLMLSSIPNVVSDNGNPDLRIIDFNIDYRFMPLEFFYKVIQCTVKNVGDASLDFVYIRGEAHHIFLKFLPGGGANSDWYFASDPWLPGEERSITTVKFPHAPFQFWSDNGFFNISMSVSHPDDPNPDDNELNGNFFIFKNTIKGIYFYE